MKTYMLLICSVLVAVTSLASDLTPNFSSNDYHNIKYNGPGRAVFLCEGHFNPDHPELVGFAKTSASIETSEDSFEESSSIEFDEDTVVSEIHNIERNIERTRQKIIVEQKAEEPDAIKIGHLTEQLNDQISDLKYWGSLLKQTPQERHEFSKMNDESFRHDTECAVRLAGISLGAAPKTPIIGIENLCDIAAYDVPHFPIVCVNKYLCCIHDDKVVERVYVKIGDGKHLLSQINASQYIELAARGALIIEAMFNGEENIEAQRRYAFDLGILANYINSKTPGAMIIVGATAIKATGEAIASLSFTPKMPGYSSFIAALGDTFSSWQWDIKTKDLIKSFPPCGASLAAPIVAAAASQISEQFTQLTAKQVRVALLSSGRKVDLISKKALSEVFANGVLDTDAALTKALLIAHAK